MIAKTLIRIVLAIVVGAPAGFIAAFLATPWLWRLEGTLGMELAGHSGPADWVLVLAMAIFSLLIFVVIRPRHRSRTLAGARHKKVD
jgi:ABC-type antimicrobial peptide transport system permease subunit